MASSAKGSTLTISVHRLKVNQGALPDTEITNLTVQTTDSISQLQARLHDIWGTPPSKQLLSVVQGGTVEQLEPEIRSPAGKALSQRTWAECGLPADLTLHLTDYDGLRDHAGDFCAIPRTEHRAITVSQLETLIGFVEKRCNKDGAIIGWRDMRTGHTLELASMNLYHMADWVIRPATYAYKCSFVELISLNAEAQMPNWFVSHWWGEAVAIFLACLTKHVQTRGLQEAAAYWVCAYSNNQHELGAELLPDPRQTSFFRAMQLCDGMVLVLDKNATAFQRSWCCFEDFVALTPDPMRLTTFLLDITTFTEEAHIITDKLTNEEQKMDDASSGRGWQVKAEREMNFPMDIIEKALNIDIYKSQASQEIDKKRILNCIVKRKMEELDEDPPSDHPEYLRVNRRLTAKFVVAGWLNAVQKKTSVLQEFSQALHVDPERTALHLVFINCAGFTNERLAEVATGLPTKLEDLRLFMGGTSIDGQGLKDLLQQLPGILKSIHLGLARVRLDDRAFQSFLQRLPSRLAHIEFGMSGTQISNAGLQALAQQLPTGLESLELNLGFNEQVGDEGIDLLMRGLPAASLHTLKLRLKGTSLTDMGMTAIARGMPPHLMVLELHLQETAVRKAGCSTLAEALPDTLSTLLFRCDNALRDLRVTAHSVEEVKAWQEQVRLKGLGKGRAAPKGGAAVKESTGPSADHPSGKRTDGGKGKARAGGKGKGKGR